MQKILDNAFIKKCGDCHPPSNKCPHWNTGVGVLRKLDTIDKDCPLQDCEVIKDFGISGDACNMLEIYPKMKPEDIDHIIIVKRSK